MTSRSSVSILILTKNEETNLARCLKSVAWADDIIVLDSFSTDRTRVIASSFHVRFYERPFDNWSDHQNWALANLPFQHPWVFNIDADEICPPDLAAEIRARVATAGAYAGFRMRRKDFWGEHWLRHATFYPTWLIRLYRVGRVRFERLVNPITVVDGDVAALDGHIIHYPFSKGVGDWIQRHNSYSGFEAIEYLKRPPAELSDIFGHDVNARRAALKALFSRLPARPLVKFLYLYVFHRGFLDGRAGFDYAMLQAIYEYCISLKVHELTIERQNVSTTEGTAPLSLD